MDQLVFEPVLDRPDIVTPSVLDCVQNLSELIPSQEICVAEIDPEACDGQEFCRRYGFDFSQGANCVVVEAVRGSVCTMVACVIPVGLKMDLGGYVRKHLGVRRVSVANKDRVLEETQMEYGSITPVGLPQNWRILVDENVAKSDRIVVGSGLRRSKLRLPGHALAVLPGAEVLSNLGIKRD